MQKETDHITVEYPWKDATEGSSIYNNSADHVASKSSDNDHQHVSHHEALPSIHHMNASGGELHGNLPLIPLANPPMIRTSLSLGASNSNFDLTAGVPPASGHLTDTAVDGINARSQNPTSEPKGVGITPTDINLVPENHQGGKPKHVSGTKRAAQNRSAQKAFRERREKYVKDLEMKAAQVSDLQKTIEQLKHENAELRDYTLALQNRLMELDPGTSNSVP